jgi:putative acetyltransferase
MDNTQTNTPVGIRVEQPEDRADIRRINEVAFGRKEEAEIVDMLRDSCSDLLSLIAIADRQPVGHILFSPVILDDAKTRPQGMGLAPMAVLPEYQRRGIGSRLVREGLGRLRSASIPFVVVLGHPDYYPRFGFRPASRYGIRCQWAGVPDPAFMILVFDEPALQGISGVARYRHEFDRGM